MVDYYSKYPEVTQLEDKTAKTVITRLKEIYARHGIPDEVVSDNMPFDSRGVPTVCARLGIQAYNIKPRIRTVEWSERVFRPVLEEDDEEGR